MRPLRTLVIYIAVVFVGGALLAPWLFWLAQAGASTFPKFAHAPFHRFVSRAVEGLALAGLWPLLRGLGATSTREVGLSRWTGQWRRLLSGLLLGLASLSLIAFVSLLAGARAPVHGATAGRIAWTFLDAALTAAVVALMEEVLFRGGIFGGLRRVFDWRFALVVSSMIYAITHFFARAPEPATVRWSSGLVELGLMLGGFTDFRQLIPGFINLTLAGMLLGIAYHRSGNLYFSIGLHAGWVFCIKCFGALTIGPPRASAWLWGSEKMVDSWLALAVLGIILVAFAPRFQSGAQNRNSLLWTI